ncbi:MAG: hypothetical protein Q9163_004722 [Psora crenata]
MSDSDTVQKALKVLCSVPQEAFLPHRAEALLAFQKLRTFVGDDGGTWTPRERRDRAPPLTNNHSSCSPPLEDHNSSSVLMVTNKSFVPALQPSLTSSLNGPNSSSTLPNTTDTSSLALHSLSSTTPSIRQPSSSPSLSGHELSPTPSVLTLTQALDRDSAQIQKFLSRPESEAIEDELERIVEDPRVVDLQLDGSRSTPKARFRKGLSQRSLAIEYTQWERHTYGSSKVSVLVEDLSVSQERGLGHIVEYLESNNCRFKKQDITRRGIEHGIKFLVFELLVGTRVISAILSFKYSLFRAVKFEDLPFLKTIVDDSKWVKELVGQKAGWYDECQSRYDAWCKKLSRTNNPYEPCSSPSEPSGKRRRLNQDANFQQFVGPSDAQPSQYQDTSQRGNRVLSTARDMANGLEGAEQNHGDAEHFRIQPHEGLFSRPSQWEDAAALMPLASGHQQSGPDAYPSGTVSNLSPDAGTPARLSSIAARSPLEETRPHRLEQTQRSAALRLPSLQHLIDGTLVAYLGYNVDSDGRDGREIGMVTDGNVTQSFSSLDQAVSQSNFMGRAPGPLSSQHRDYARGPVGSSRTVLGRDTHPGDDTLQIDAPLPLPEAGDLNAWAGNLGMENVTSEETLQLPNSGDLNAWAERLTMRNAMGEQTLPLPEAEDLNAWTGNLGMRNTMGEQTLPLPEAEDLNAWAGNLGMRNTMGEQTLPLPEAEDLNAWAGNLGIDNTMAEKILPS